MCLLLVIFFAWLVGVKKRYFFVLNTLEFAVKSAFFKPKISRFSPQKLSKSVEIYTIFLSKNTSNDLEISPNSHQIFTGFFCKNPDFSSCPKKILKFPRKHRKFPLHIAAYLSIFRGGGKFFYKKVAKKVEKIVHR